MRPPGGDKGLHLKLYRFSPQDYKEIVAVFKGPHPGKQAGLPDEPLGEVANPGNGSGSIKKGAKKAKSKA